MRVLGLTLAAAVLLAGAVARADVVLTPSARAGTCVLEPPTDVLRPVPKGCLPGDVKGEPVFSADGTMLYLTGAVFARDTRTGVLSPLGCQTPVGGSRCPPAHSVIAISPDGRFLYALERTRFVLDVYDRGEDGTLTQVQCLEIRNPAAPADTCDAVLPRSMTYMRLSPDGTALYLAGNVDGDTDSGPTDDAATLVRLARDPSTGRVTVEDCLTGAGQSGCRSDDDLHDIAGIDAVVDQDVYLVGIGTYGDAFLAFRTDPQTHAMTAICGDLKANDPAGCGSAPSNPYPSVLDVAPAPDGRSLYVSGGSVLYAYPRDPATGRLGTARCVALQSLITGRRTCSRDGFGATVAVSADGRTVIMGAGDSRGFSAAGGIVGTFRVNADGSYRAVGCVGRSYGCAPPIGLPRLVRYPPNGPGPYLMTTDHGKGAIQLLAPAPTVSVHKLTFRGPNRVSLSCPADRTQACRGTIRISYITNPRGFDPLEAFTYDVPPGASRPVSLRLKPAARRSARRVGANVDVVVRVFDSAGLTTPSGVATCLQASRTYRCSPPPTI